MKKIIPFVLLFVMLFASVGFQSLSDISILLHGNALPIFDETGRTWTNNGAGISTTQYKFGGGSISFNGNAEITTADFSDSYLGDGRPFAFDWWMKLNALPANQNKISIYNQGTDVSHFVNIEIFNNGGQYVLVLETANGGIEVAVRYLNGLTTGTWNHFVVQYDTSQYSFYQNCTRLTNGYSNSLQFVNFSTPVRLGRFLNGGHGVNGYIDEFTMTRSVRFTGSTCTLPTGEYGSGTPTITFTPPPTFSPTLTPTPSITPTTTQTPVITTFTCPDGETVIVNPVNISQVQLWCE